jgi:hypothetical protein
VPLAAWFRRHGADVVLVPAERSADLTKDDVDHVKEVPELTCQAGGGT